MPTVLAASTISVPAGTVILWPSIVRLMSGTRQHLSYVARVPQAVVFVLRVEVAHRGLDHPARGVAQAAQASPVLEPVRNALQESELELRPLIREDAVVGANRPVGADAAGRALAARLEGVEPQQSGGCLHDAVRIVHADDTAGSPPRAQHL